MNNFGDYSFDLLNLEKKLSELVEEVSRLRIASVFNKESGWIESDIRKLNFDVNRPSTDVRIRNCLYSQDIRTVGDLISYSGDELKSMPNFGAVLLLKVRGALEKIGISLSGDAPRKDESFSEQ